MSTQVIRKCRYCHEHFTPDHRNTYHQHYCSRSECRRASKTASQKKWLFKHPEYYSCQIHRDYCRAWRERNPLYSIEYHRTRPRKPRPRVDALELVVDGCRQLEKRILRAKHTQTCGKKDFVPLLDILSAQLTAVEAALNRFAKERFHGQHACLVL